MIPADAASRLRLLTPDLPTAPQAVPPAQQIADILSELVPGQRILAEIQALLPNGTYRAIVGQRDVTLALPFSAKPGDALELEVVETDGKMSLAFVANRGGESPAEQPGSVATQLSQTGRLIGDLLTGIGEEGRKAQPAPLNGNQPVVETMPAKAADLVPMLKEAIVKSGMFYESHQAQWVEGRLPTTALLQQPQGQLSPLLARALEFQPPGAASLRTPDNHDAAPEGQHTERSASGSAPPAHASELPAPAGTKGEPPPVQSANLEQRQPIEIPADNKTTPLPAVRTELTPLVQQQLDALSNQTYVWQGQIWPGQTMHWEISEDASRRPSGEEMPERWQTRLVLNLPQLGNIEATIRLRSAGEVEIALTTGDSASRSRLLADAGDLRQQLEAAGLALTGWTVSDAEPAR